MAISIARPFTSLRATLEIKHPEETAGRFGPQIQVDLEVIDDGEDGDHNGETFRDWFGLDANGNVKVGTRTWQLINAALGGNFGENCEAEDLNGRRFCAQVGTNEKGTHSKVLFDTIGPAPVKQKPRERAEVETNDLPYGTPNPPNFHDPVG
jgi:hypothetical protein